MSTFVAANREIQSFNRFCDEFLTQRTQRLAQRGKAATGVAERLTRTEWQNHGMAESFLKKQRGLCPARADMILPSMILPLDGSLQQRAPIQTSCAPERILTESSAEERGGGFPLRPLRAPQRPLRLIRPSGSLVAAVPRCDSDHRVVI